MKSRKSIKIGEKLKDLEVLKVPGPGVLYFLFSHTNSLNMIMILGQMEVAVILLPKILDSKTLLRMFPGQGLMKTSLRISNLQREK